LIETVCRAVLSVLRTITADITALLSWAQSAQKPTTLYSDYGWLSQGTAL
jgi:hypothetical protein